ncbi:MAG: GAF domain-containing sensor histidine kinase [Deltaproteobacteria bacterium]|nr:GAF domain-containing sensor histidine kinase [Deltaproteobacteria bacterium]MBI3390097.1 GAF domain-containing sensor histidine kinase [Deltaproteobacteria bacterium]
MERSWVSAVFPKLNELPHPQLNADIWNRKGPLPARLVSGGRFVDELQSIGGWTADEETLLADLAASLSPHIDQIAQVWADRLLGIVGPALGGSQPVAEWMSSANRCFLDDLLRNLRARNLDAVFQENLERYLGLLQGQCGSDLKLRSTLSQLYSSLEISSALITEWACTLYANDARLPALLAAYTRVALHLGQILGKAADAYRAREQRETSRVNSSLLQASRDLKTRPASAALALDDLRHIIAQRLRCDSTLAFAWDESEQAFLSVTKRERASASLDAVQPLRVDSTNCPIIQAVLGGDVVSGMAEDGRLPRALIEAHRVATYALAPITNADGQRVGLFAVLRREREPFSVADRQILEGIAQHGGLALENASLAEQLHSAARLKTDFINSMSHEIRTPLNVLFGYLDILEDRHGGDGDDGELLDRMRRNAEQLLTLIDTLLDLGRLEQGRMKLCIETFSVEQVFTEVQRRSSAPRGLTFRCSADPGLPALTSDRFKLADILTHLVANAFKFTERGHVSVHAKRAGDDSVALEVIDTGAGIGPESLSVIFDLFRRVGPVDRGGTGVGLYLVKRLTQLLGGYVSVESRLGCGSTFRVEIPDAFAPAIRAAS